MRSIPLRRPLAALLVLGLVLAQSNEAFSQAAAVLRGAGASPTAVVPVAGTVPSATVPSARLFGSASADLVPRTGYSFAALPTLPPLRLPAAAAHASARTDAAFRTPVPARGLPSARTRTATLPSGPAASAEKETAGVLESLDATGAGLAKDPSGARAPALLSLLFESSRRGVLEADPAVPSSAGTAVPSGLVPAWNASSARAEPAPPSADVPSGSKRGVVGQLWFWILVALAAGAGAGLLAPSLPALGTALHGAEAFGGIFLTILKRLAGPLIFSSVVGAIGGHEDPKQLGHMSGLLLAYFVFTSATACLIGTGLASLLRPGLYIVRKAVLHAPAAAAGASPGLAAFLSGIVPSDPLTPFLTGNTLQISFMGVLVGAGLLLLNMYGPESARRLGRRVVLVAEGMRAFVLRLVQGLMLASPVAVFGLTGKLLAGAGLGTLVGMSAYVGTVLLGLALLLSFYCMMVRAYAGLSPRAYLAGVREAMVAGFSTASSSVTMPVSLKAAIGLGVDPKTAGLLITMGSAVNMEGTALYQSVAVVFLAQAFGVPLPAAVLAHTLVVLLVSSLGTPGTPGAGMAVLSTAMSGAGIPGEGVALILGVDRILDMARTAVNVVGDITSAVMMDAFLKKRAARPTGS